MARVGYAGVPMYQILLTRKYLLSKIMPLLAAISLSLCTGLVLVVWSVMGGFLSTLLDTGRTFAGDVTITWPSGIPYYQRLLEIVRKDPRVHAATPVIETFALMRLPDDRVEGVQVRGIDGPSYAATVGYDKALWWRPISEPIKTDEKGLDPRLSAEKDWKQIYDDGMSLTRRAGRNGPQIPAAVVGIDASGFNKLQDEGYYIALGLVRPKSDGNTQSLPRYLFDNSITLNLIPLDSQGRLQTLVSKTLPVANEFRTGVSEMDRRTVFVQFDEMQRLMKMDAVPKVVAKSGGAFNPYEGVDKTGDARLPEIPTGELAPARTSSVLVKAKQGVSADELREAMTAAYAQFAREFRDVPSVDRLTGANLIRTWAQANATLVNQVKRETALVLFLFWFITLVCSVLILAIFWAMISEKTKDIGVLRSVGATRSGIAGLWIGYGLILGVVGSLAGLALGYFVVTNINAIHEALGRYFGLYIWEPRVYLFSGIPDKVNPWHALIVTSAGIGFAVLGAIVPALRAALMQPVRALRFE